ncbi:septal ring lytic transglycosylase RlpA family protein [Pelagibacterium montanilacus]|uniref:septal ring lytic transglycosylase RlpA family protein n=1 Tax=Pelagibacterium montanilacus TaxID=2185280 RepID=UPI000F8D766E|nr:septal ring lytic transglycosylase RlpA family protein [Pelagibacterium montanilacus]
MTDTPAATRKRHSRLTVIALGLAAITLAGCEGGPADLFAGNEFFSESSMGVSASPRVTTSKNVPKGGGRYQVGQPYTVAGQTFTPREQPGLDQTGQASWYGPAFHGRLTANGEVFDQYHLSGAHPTLPLPSYVRVTNLDNGTSAIVRINDRGPFSKSRVIDLSRRTAEVLGYKQQGMARVRVQYVGPAPLEGDDTRFLTASINQPMPASAGATRMAYADEPAAAPASSAVAQASAQAMVPPADLPFQLLSYGQSGQSMGVELEVEPNGEPVWIALGEYGDPLVATELEQSFALLGAVERRELVNEGRVDSVHLALTHLRAGVTGEDVTNLAAELGLPAPILY